MTNEAGPADLPDERRDLRADCSRCQGLCCVAPAFARSADFAIDKPAGRACPKLSSDFSCSIHADLRGQGFSGCTVFDCFGAGQQVVQVTFSGQDWRQTPETAASMFNRVQRDAAAEGASVVPSRGAGCPTSRAGA